MGFQIIKPSSLLTPFVKQYWAMESVLPPGKAHQQRIVPNGFVEWTFYLEDQPLYQRANESGKSVAMISGQQYGYYDIAISGKLSLFSVVFSPFGAKHFLKMPIQELVNQSVASEIILTKYTQEIASKLYEANTMNQRVELIENFLIQKSLTDCSLNLSRLSKTFHNIDRTRATTSVDKLASDVCLSRKQFERVFSDHVGLPPKKYLRIIRFQQALHSKQLVPGLSLTSLSHECGYYDQSHMINDFKQFTGLSPKNYFANCLPFSDYFSDPI